MALLPGFLQPDKSLLLITHRGIHTCDIIILLHIPASLLFQLIEQLLCLVLPVEPDMRLRARGLDLASIGHPDRLVQRW